ncbi:hypothetical protein D3C87_513590 [compost metagenome]
MTLRTTISVTCQCAYTGTVQRSENDQPMSDCWEKFTPMGDLIGNEYYVDGFAKGDKVNKAMNLKCPTCKSPLKLFNS